MAGSYQNEPQQFDPVAQDDGTRPTPPRAVHIAIEMESLAS